ncbi:MAG: CrcB family protein [Staphylococcus epidermidis]|nr:CrcB family protein [Staphylococcus epidermidis]
MITILLVMLGGGIGAVLRALITNICQRLFMFPFFVTGVLGGLTTFSTLSSELVNMLSPQFKPIRFVVYSLLQFILGFIACFYGYRI